jgi:hypothetical protein
VVRPAPPDKPGGLWEKRYKFKIAADQYAEVERLVGVHHFLTIKTKDRPAIPEEAHPTIVVVTKAGQVVKATKLGNDKHPDFDAIYRYLLTFGQPSQEQEPVYEGAFDWDWRPEGFERPW